MTPTEPIAIGLSVLERARDGRFAEIREMYAPQLRAMVSAEALRGAGSAAVAEQGAVTTTGSPVSEPAGPRRWRRRFSSSRAGETTRPPSPTT
jgi:uncharacterized protein